MSNQGPPPDTAFCQECGQELRSDAQFCDRCGAEQSNRQSTAGGTHDQSARSAGQPGHQQQGTPQRQSQQRQRQSGWNADASESRVSRRGVIAAGGIVSVGVLGGGVYWYMQNDSPTFELASDPWVTSDVNEESYRSTLTGELELESGEYATRDLELEMDQTVELRVSVDSGLVDMALFPRVEFERYREEKDDTRAVSALSTTGITDEFNATSDVLNGDYVLVFDNTGVYGTSPEGMATFEVVLEARVLSQNWFDYRDQISSLEGVSEVDVLSSYRSWYVLYEAGNLDSETITEELQTILFEYANQVPESDEHEELYLEYRGDSTYEYEIPQQLALKRTRGEITEQEYLDQISEENSL
jgi:hypothetical protein